MQTFNSEMEWIEAQAGLMHQLVENWCNINSFSGNPDGLSRMLAVLQEAFDPLNAEITKPAETVLSLRKRSNAPIQVLLCGHYDSVFVPNSPFQTCKLAESERLQGPATADMKGGLVIMLMAISALEKSPLANQIGWEILLTSDEEVGSPRSAPYLQKVAKNHHIGLVFESSFPDGAFAGSRKGSANFTLTVQGRAAHVGRNFDIGRNAIYGLASLLAQIERWAVQHSKIIVSPGFIEGGGPTNIVPDRALCRINVRCSSKEELEQFHSFMFGLSTTHSTERELEVVFEKETDRPPKPFDAPTQRLFSHFCTCSESLHLPFLVRDTAGVCDGNTLASAGLPTIDTLGAIGGGIHTRDEYILLPSLVSRSQLTALFLLRLACGDITVESLYG